MPQLRCLPLLICEGSWCVLLGASAGVHSVHGTSQQFTVVHPNKLAWCEGSVRGHNHHEQSKGLQESQPPLSGTVNWMKDVKAATELSVWLLSFFTTASTLSPLRHLTSRFCLPVSCEAFHLETPSNTSPTFHVLTSFQLVPSPS